MLAQLGGFDPAKNFFCGRKFLMRKGPKIRKPPNWAVGRRLQALAPGLTPRSVFDKFAAVQMIDVHIPTTDGRELLLERYTEPEKDLKLLLSELKLTLPEQPPSKITASAPIAEAGV